MSIPYGLARELNGFRGIDLNPFAPSSLVKFVEHLQMMHGDYSSLLLSGQ
jgi:hypothetical protein